MLLPLLRVAVSQFTMPATGHAAQGERENPRADSALSLGVSSFRRPCTADANSAKWYRCKGHRDLKEPAMRCPRRC